MKCPVCEVELTMSERQGIEIDYCPKCRGIWLDRGELDKIIERSVSYDEDLNKQQSFHNDKDDDFYKKQRYENDQYYKKNKRRSFLGDIFDF
ncbi:MAG: zf-TFIIB domain-containing protein [Ignavibacteriales bacterium]|nr:MAG: zf-TFIIB domain-containing protein [Ignavibacteriales bacterium]